MAERAVRPRDWRKRHRDPYAARFRRLAVMQDGTREYALVLGSNQHPARHLRLALQRLRDEYDVLGCAGPLRTRDAGGGRFLNAALCVRSPLAPEAVRASIQAIEDAAGRRRGSDRVSLDIDLVASRGADGVAQVHKPDDLRRGYVRELLARIGFA